MDAGDWWTVESTAADVYERVLVPAVFEKWVPRLLAAGEVRYGDRVLDVACGTGVVARGAMGVVGPEGCVAGLDLTEAMLTVAQRVEPAVLWELGDAMDMPFDDETFDVALCQAGLMFFPDRIGALREMRRVLRPGGRLAVQVWGAAAPQAAFADIVEQHSDKTVADRYRSPWSFPYPNALQAEVAAAGFSNVEVQIVAGENRFKSVEHFLSSTAVLLADHIDLDDLVTDTAEAFARYRTREGTLRLPAPGNIATAQRP
jgi:ubiquinone/menaquinone biosynthesis C-methylase UbiE